MYLPPPLHNDILKLSKEFVDTLYANGVQNKLAVTQLKQRHRRKMILVHIYSI